MAEKKPEIHFKTLKEYQEVKEKLKKYNRAWKLYAGKKYVGSCSFLFRKYNPRTNEEFFSDYFKDGITGDPLEKIERGRTMDELWDIAEKYKQRAFDLEINNEDKDIVSSIPLENFVDDCIVHIVMETLVGQTREREMKEALESWGYEVVYGDEDEDYKMNIDLIAKKNGIIKNLIQVKPNTTFISNGWASHQSIVEDRARFFEKHKEGNIRYGGIPYDYYIYHSRNELREMENNGLWHKNPKTNAFSFKLEDICFLNGRVPDANKELFINGEIGYLPFNKT
jgi:hypothetical protein